MTIQLLQAWYGHPAGTTLDEIDGAALLLIQKGIAQAVAGEGGQSIAEQSIALSGSRLGGTGSKRLAQPPHNKRLPEPPSTK